MPHEVPPHHPHHTGAPELDSATPTLHEEPTIVDRVHTKDRNEISRVYRSRQSDTYEDELAEEDIPTPDENTIVVDWDGPDDPENPKKYVGQCFRDM